MSKLWLTALIIQVVANGALAVQAGVERKSPPQKVGKQTVVTAYGEDGAGNFTGTLAFIVDGKRTEAPPASTGFHSQLSAAGWETKNGKITGLKFWQYNGSGRKRKVVLSYPDYKVISRGAWQKALGTDFVEDPPK